MAAREIAWGRLGSVVAIVVLLLAASTALPIVAAAETAAADSWPTAAPEAAGLDSGALAELLTQVKDQDVPLHSLLLMRDGTVFHYPYDGSIYHDVASVTKSVLTTLVGHRREPGAARPRRPRALVLPRARRGGPGRGLGARDRATPREHDRRL